METLQRRSGLHAGLDSNDKQNPKVKLDDFCVLLDFIFGMQATLLDDLGSGLDADVLQQLHNPPTYPASIGGDKALEAAIKLYSRSNHSDSNYNIT